MDGDAPPASAGRLRLAGLGVLALAAVLRLWRLDQNGYDNEYYAAAVRSMASGWRAFLYNSFDPAGFVSVDKPPLGLWVQVASARLFGFSWASLLAPQVLDGVAAVWIVGHLVARRFGAGAGLLAALFLALTPVSVAVDRSGNVDSCLVLVLLLAAWALSRAAEEGRRGLLVLSMALVGLGFNVKMLAAWVVLPTFVLVYLAGDPVSWRRRIADLALGGLVLGAVSLSWALVYDLTPPDRRPFAGSTRENSMLELAVGHNGVGRFVRAPRPVRAGAVGRRPVTPATGGASIASPGETAPRPNWSAYFVQVPVGPLRLADGQLAGQVGWLAPLAVMGLALGALRRWPLSTGGLALVLWAGWALTFGVVYSYAGGIFHFYYLATMAPPLAALAGVGVSALWARYLYGGWRALLLPAALVVTAAWQAYVEASALASGLEGSRAGIAGLLGVAAGASGDWRVGLHRVLLGGTLGAALALLGIAALRAARPGRGRALGAAALGLGMAALLVLPAAWALSSVLVKGIAVLPSADLSRLASLDAGAGVRRRARGPADTGKLVEFLLAHREGARFLLATTGTRIAAPIIIETGEPVMAMGGFHGLDPILTPEGLARLVEANQVRFVMLGDLSLISRRMGGEVAGRPIADWVRANGKLVDPALWQAGAGDDAAAEGGRRRLRLYDLRP